MLILGITKCIIDIYNRSSSAAPRSPRLYYYTAAVTKLRLGDGIDRAPGEGPRARRPIRTIHLIREFGIRPRKGTLRRNVTAAEASITGYAPWRKINGLPMRNTSGNAAIGNERIGITPAY